MPVDLDAPNRAALRLFGDKAQKGAEWTYTPQAGLPFDIDAIYDEAWNTLGVQNIGRGGIAPVSTTKPAVLVRVADLPAGFRPRQKDQLRRNSTGINYQIADSQVDGMGCYRLILNKVAS